MTPTFSQMQHFFTLVASGKITVKNFQMFLGNPNKFVEKNFFPTLVDYTVGLTQLIQNAIGADDLKNINKDITPERFVLREGVRNVDLALISFLDGETGEQAAQRLVADGYTLEGIGELAQFTADYPNEVQKYAWVVVLNKESRWTNSHGSILVPCICVEDSSRHLALDDFRDDFYSNNRILVSRHSK